MHLNMPYDMIDLFLPGQVVQNPITTMTDIASTYNVTSISNASSSSTLASTETVIGIPYTSPNSDGKYPYYTIQSYAELNSERYGSEWSNHNPNGTSFAESIGRYFGHIKDLQTYRSHYQSSNKAPRQVGPNSCVAFVPVLKQLLIEDPKQIQFITGRGNKPSDTDSYRCGLNFWIKPKAPNVRDIEYIAEGHRILILTDL
jgi:hypothetical protein